MNGKHGAVMATVVGAFVVTLATADAKGAAVESNGPSGQSIAQMEDQSTMSLSGNCYGTCGVGCSMTCGTGGACQTHDYYVRSYGLYSSPALSAYPAAAVQWGSCMMGRAKVSASTSITSRYYGYTRPGTTRVSGIL